MKNYRNVLTSTTLIPLWAKAVESEEKDPIVMDPNACSILKALGYGLDHYSKWRQNASQVGCCLRARWIDDETLKYIERTGRCQVIQLGAGIDDRFRRIGMPREVERWYDLDLEEVAEMRKEVIPEVERNEIVSMNMFDTAWMERLHRTHLPTLIIIEGVLMYMKAEDISRMMNDIALHLGNATLLFDSLPAMGVGRAKYHDSVKKYDRRVEYEWGINEESDVEALSGYIHSVEMTYMSDLPKASRFIWPLRMAFKTPFFYKNANQRLLKCEISGCAENAGRAE